MSKKCIVFGKLDICLFAQNFKTKSTLLDFISYTTVIVISSTRKITNLAYKNFQPQFKIITILWHKNTHICKYIIIISL